MSREDLIEYRHGTSTAWTSTNPTLAHGEPGVESDTHKVKHGNGVDPWNDITTYSDEGVPGDPGVDGTDGVSALIRRLGDPLPDGIVTGDQLFRPEY